LKLSPKADVERSERTLRGMGVEETISGASADVEYMAMLNMEKVSVANLDKLLVPGDLRRDPYISNVSRLFESNDSPLIYIRAKRGLSYYKAVLESQKEIVDWQLMDRLGPRKLLGPLIFTAMAALVAFFGSVPRGRLARLMSAIPLAICIFLVAPSSIIPMVLVFYLSPTALEARSRSYACRIVIYFGYASALASILVAYVGMQHLSLLAVLLSELVYSILVTRTGRLTLKKALREDKELSRRMESEIPQSKNREHQLFNPIPLFHGGSMHSLKAPFRAINDLPLIVLVLVISLIPESTSINHDPLPYARKSTEDFDDLEAMQFLYKNREIADLPDISLLIASAVYQEGLPFGVEIFRLPRLDEKLVLRNYFQVGNAIETTENTVIEYNQDWYKRQLSRHLGTSVGKLFASLEGPSPVLAITRQPMRGKNLRDSSAMILCGITFAAILILVLISHYIEAHKRFSTSSLSGDERVRAA